MAATAPKNIAIGLEPNVDAAPVLWGTPPPVVVEDGLGVLDAVLERVAEEMVLLVPTEELTEPEALEVTETVVGAAVVALLVGAAVDEEEGAADVASLPERPMGPM